MNIKFGTALKVVFYAYFICWVILMYYLVYDETEIPMSRHHLKIQVEIGECFSYDF